MTDIITEQSLQDIYKAYRTHSAAADALLKRISADSHTVEDLKNHDLYPSYKKQVDHAIKAKRKISESVDAQEDSCDELTTNQDEHITVLNNTLANKIAGMIDVEAKSLLSDPNQ